MKKINLFAFVFSSVLLFSCNSGNNENNEVIEEEVQSAEENLEVEANVESSSSIPAFESAELVAFTKAFDDYFNRSMELLKKGDMAGLKAIEEEGKSLQEKSEIYKSKVSESDKALFDAYLMEKGKEMLSVSGLDKLGEKMNEVSTK